MSDRFKVLAVHGEGATVFNVIDTWAPEPEQPAVIHSWSTAKEPNARYLARSFCERHNAKEEDPENPGECFCCSCGLPLPADGPCSTGCEDAEGGSHA